MLKYKRMTDGVKELPRGLNPWIAIRISGCHVPDRRPHPVTLSEREESTYTQLRARIQRRLPGPVPLLGDLGKWNEGEPRFFGRLAPSE